MFGLRSYDHAGKDAAEKAVFIRTADKQALPESSSAGSFYCHQEIIHVYHCLNSEVS